MTAPRTNGPTPPRPRQPRDYRTRDAAEIEAQASISADDITDAIGVWRRDAPAGLRALLGASLVPDDNPTPDTP